MKIKKIILIVLALAVVFSCAACGSTKKDPAEYHKTADAFCTDVSNAAETLSIMAQYQLKYLEAMKAVSGKAKAEDLIEGGYKQLEKHASLSPDDIKKTYDDICSKYRDLLAFEPEGQVEKEIEVKIKELFEAFNSLYNLVTSPPTSYNSYANPFIEAGSTIIENISLISALTVD